MHTKQLLFSIFLRKRIGKEVGKEDTPNLKKPFSDRWFYLCHGAEDNSVCATAATRRILQRQEVVT